MSDLRSLPDNPRVDGGHELEPGPVFIVGVGRSGTSLVQSMLAAHSLLALPPETGFIRRFVIRGELKRVAEAEGRDAVAKRLESDDRFQRLGIDAGELVEGTVRNGHLTDANLYRQMLRLYARKQDKPRYGDKDPRLIEHLEPLSRMFPEAWVVHVVRDPRDVLLSKKKAAWSHARPVLRHVFAHRVQFKMGRRNGPRFFGERYVEVQYEQLLSQPRQTLRALCSSLSLSFEAQMLDFHGAAANLVSPAELAWKSETLGPLLTQNAGKWRDGLSAWEAIVTERVCIDAMATGGYEPGAAPLSNFAARISVGLVQLLLLVSDTVYRAIRTVRNRLVQV